MYIHTKLSDFTIVTVLFTDLHDGRLGTTHITYYLHAHNSVSTLNRKFVFGICNKGTRIGAFKIISKYFSENKKWLCLFDLVLLVSHFYLCQFYRK